MLDAIPDTIFHIRKDGTLLNLKASNDDILFLAPEMFLGRKIDDVMPKKIAKQALHYIEQALRTNELQMYQYQLSIEGNIRHFESRLVVSGDDEVLAIITDITERKRAEEVLMKKTQRLERFVKLAIGREKKMNELKYKSKNLAKSNNSDNIWTGGD